MRLITLITALHNGTPLTQEQRRTYDELVRFLGDKTLADLELDNLLVAQKDSIHNVMLLTPEEADTALEVVRELWETYNYGYKYQEMKQRIATYKASLEPEE